MRKKKQVQVWEEERSACITGCWLGMIMTLISADKSGEAADLMTGAC